MNTVLALAILLYKLTTFKYSLYMYVVEYYADLNK